MTIMGPGVLSGVMECSGIRWRRWLHNKCTSWHGLVNLKIVKMVKV